MVGIRRLVLIVILLIGLVLPSGAATNHYVGRTVSEVLEEMRSDGIPLAYSTNLVTSDLRINQQPSGIAALDIINEILNPHRLKAVPVEGLYLIVRQPADEVKREVATLLVMVEREGSQSPIDPTVRIDPQQSDVHQLGYGLYQFSDMRPGHYQINISAPGFHDYREAVTIHPSQVRVISADLQLAPADLGHLVIATSRYELNRELDQYAHYIDQRMIQSMPDLGEDPLRTMQRLPGAAATPISARSHFRGGEHNEVGIFLNGQRLLDPFHIRDYHSIFSVIDSRAIQGVEVYTGSFPSRYGNAMSGIVLVDSLQPKQTVHTEIGLGVFHTSLMSSGRWQDGASNWLVSARRGNLDQVLQERLGEPGYHDAFAQLTFEPSADTNISVNALYAQDKVTVVLEAQPEEREQSDSNTDNRQWWIEVDHAWNPQLEVSTIASHSRFSNQRLAMIDDEEKIIAQVQDRREIDVFGLKQDWRWYHNNHLWQWGWEFEDAQADYRYIAKASYFGTFDLFQHRQQQQDRFTETNPKGTMLGLYFADRWQLNQQIAIDLGLRWDRRGISERSSHWSPRFSIRHILNPTTTLRISLGRHYQAQQIHQLQVEDGIDHFFPPQRADHWVIGLQHQIHDGYIIRAEAYQKQMDHLRPRYENLLDTLALIPELQPDRHKISPSSATARGLELSLGYEARQDWQWWLSYTWSEVVDRVGSRSIARSWDQRHTLYGGFAWATPQWDISVAGSWHSGWPITDVNLDPLAPQSQQPALAFGPRNATRLGNYAALDLRVNRRFKMSRGELSIFFELSNALDRENTCCIDFELVEQGDNVFSIERDHEFWLPLLPSIGLLWEF